MRLYICGPISSNPDYKQEFKFVEESLVEAGHTVCNPAALPFPEGTKWEEFMKKDLIEMLQCDGVAIVHTNVPSKGQALEMLIANQLGIPCRDFETYLGVSN